MSTCPKCQQALHPIEYHGIEVSQCGDCESFWFKDGQFREVKQIGFSGLSAHAPSEKAPEADDTDGNVEELTCPECAVLLMPFTYAYSSGIQLHRCAQCRGIWAQHKDLLRIDELLSGYQESLEEAKAKVLPLMMKVKEQITREEHKKEAQKKKTGMFNRFFGPRGAKRQNAQNLFDDHDSHDDRHD